MRIINDSALQPFRGPGPCGYCKKWCRRREPHHLWASGAGSGNKIDAAINLIALGASSPYPLCLCHGDVTDGRIDNSEMIALVAQRERTRSDCIEATILLIRRLPKDPTWSRIEYELAQLEGGARELAAKVIGHEMQRRERKRA